MIGGEGNLTPGFTEVGYSPDQRVAAERAFFSVVAGLTTPERINGFERVRAARAMQAHTVHPPELAPAVIDDGVERGVIELGDDGKYHVAELDEGAIAMISIRQRVPCLDQDKSVFRALINSLEGQLS